MVHDCLEEAREGGCQLDEILELDLPSLQPKMLAAATESVRAYIGGMIMLSKRSSKK